MHFDEYPFTCQCEKRVSSFALLLVILKWHSSEGVKSVFLFCSICEHFITTKWVLQGAWCLSTLHGVPLHVCSSLCQRHWYLQPVEFTCGQRCVSACLHQWWQGWKHEHTCMFAGQHHWTHACMFASQHHWWKEKLSNCITVATTKWKGISLQRVRLHGVLFDCTSCDCSGLGVEGVLESTCACVSLFQVCFCPPHARVFAPKLAMMLYHHGPECHRKSVGCCLKCLRHTDSSNPLKEKVKERKTKSVNDCSRMLELTNLLQPSKVWWWCSFTTNLDCCLPSYGYSQSSVNGLSSIFGTAKLFDTKFGVLAFITSGSTMPKDQVAVFQTRVMWSKSPECPLVPKREVLIQWVSLPSVWQRAEVAVNKVKVPGSEFSRVFDHLVSKLLNVFCNEIWCVGIYLFVNGVSGNKFELLSMMFIAWLFLRYESSDDS